MTREEAIEIINRENDPNDTKVWEVFPEYREALDMAIKALSQEPCDDAVSREAVLDIVCGVYKKDGWGESNFYKAIKALPFVTQKPIECDDAVSREAILSKIKEVCFSKEWTQFRVNNGSHGQRDFIIDYIEKLPSVTHKSGKWNEYYTSQKGNDVFNCKECGHTFVVTQGKDNMNFCPNCGAKMVRSQESEDNK